MAAPLPGPARFRVPVLAGEFFVFFFFFHSFYSIFYFFFFWQSGFAFFYGKVLNSQFTPRAYNNVMLVTILVSPGTLYFRNNENNMYCARVPAGTVKILYTVRLSPRPFIKYVSFSDVTHDYNMCIENSRRTCPATGMRRKTARVPVSGKAMEQLLRNGRDGFVCFVSSIDSP